MSELDVKAILENLNNELQEFINTQSLNNPMLIGIRTGGVWIAQSLQDLLGIKDEIGVLDITFYRDDFSRVGIQPTVKPSQLPLSLDDKNIILVDDVLHTGRTVRAALNEIFDYGRPASVNLAVLVDRGSRELPIQADVVGSKIELEPEKHIKLIGPDPLKLEIVE